MNSKSTAVLTLIMMLSSALAYGQVPPRVGDHVTDFQIQKVINFSGQAPSAFSRLQKELTVLDFFGTWCLPCIKALPNLSAINRQYNTRISVVLVSMEKANHLQSFINARKPFDLPVVVDIDSSISQLFMPPSYPFTVIIGKDDKILAITEAASLTAEKIGDLLNSQMKTSVVSAPEVSAPGVVSQPTRLENKVTQAQPITMNKSIQLSQDFIYGAKTGADVQPLFNRLNSNEKKAFWINVYNGFTQFSLRNHPEQYKSRSNFYGKKEIHIAGKKFSLDDIEHGILRRSKIKWSLGYVNKIFPGSTERDLRVSRLDYRIHFALNCGAKSCPPIAFYQPSTIDQQLNVATRSYLGSEVEYDPKKNNVMLPAIMGWFRADFGGTKNMVTILQQNALFPEAKEPGIHFKKYDWSLYLDNYKN
jgi:thiol-disulfide isomerase/thioredoxin